MTLTAEAKCPFNFTQPNKRFVLNLHCNGSKRFLFVNAIKIYQFQISIQIQKILQLTIWKNGLKKSCKMFFVDFKHIDTNYVSDIYKYLMKRT